MISDYIPFRVHPLCSRPRRIGVINTKQGVYRMADCPYIQNCPFFNDQLVNIPPISIPMKRLYCRMAYYTCARYLVAKSRGLAFVPSDLFPSHKQYALELITLKSPPRYYY